MNLGHRVSTSATPAQVWDLLGHPARWPEFDPFLRRVHGAKDDARPGQTLLGVARFTGVRIPIDVVDAVAEQRLEMYVRTAPGVSERVVYDLAPTLRGGTSVRMSVVVEGLFARAAVTPLWLANAFNARLLVAQAERAARAARRAGRGAA